MYHTNDSNWKFKKILNFHDEKELLSKMYHTNDSNWKFKKILNFHDEKELLKLSIYVK